MKRIVCFLICFLAFVGYANAGNMDWLRVSGESKFHGKTYFYNEIELGGENVNDIITLIDGSVTNDQLPTALAVKNYMSSVPGDDLGSATYLDVVDLWDSGSCTGYLKSDGSCDTPPGDNLGSASASDIVTLFNSGSCSGYLKSNGNCDTPPGDNLGTATYSDVADLWASGSCTGYLKSDGNCDTPPGDDLGSASASDVVTLFNSGTCSGYLKSDGNCDTPPGDDLGSAVASDIVTLFNSGTCSGYLKSDGNCDTPPGDNLGSAAASDIVALFNSGSCSGYLKSNGNCDTPPGDNLGSATYSTVVALWASGSCTGYLKSDGTCSSPSATPGGSDSYVQYNDGGVFGGIAGFTIDDTNIYLNLTKVTDGSAAANLRFYRADAGPGLSDDGDILGNIKFHGYDGDSYENAANILALVDGTASNGDMPGALVFYTSPDGSATPLERMRISQEGYIGIGIDPFNQFVIGNTDNYSNAILVAAGTGTVSGFLGLAHVRNTLASPSATQSSDLLGRIDFGGYDNDSYEWGPRVSAYADENWDATHRGSHMRFYTNPIGSVTTAERMRITNDGKVGISETAPTGMLHLKTTSSGVAPNIYIEEPSNDASYGSITGRKKRVTSIVQNNDVMLNISAHGFDGSNYQVSSFISMFVDGTPGANDMPGAIEFWTSPDGTASCTSKLKIGNAGIEEAILTDGIDTDHTASGAIAYLYVNSNTTGVGAAMYVDSNAYWNESDADSTSTMPCRGLALQSGSGSEKKILLQGFFRDDSYVWTPGSLLYASLTTGAITNAAPSGTGDQIQLIGYAITEDIIYFNPNIMVIEHE